MSSFDSKFLNVQQAIALETQDKSIAIVSAGNVLVYDYQGHLLNDFNTGRQEPAILMAKSGEQLLICSLNRGPIAGDGRH